MIQRRERLGLPLETREPLRISSEELWEHLDRDVAIQLRVARAIYLAHAARAESAQNLVRAYPGPGMYDHAADPDYRLQMYRGHRQLGLPRNGVAALVGVSGLLSLVLAVHNSTVILRND